jgi:hypothetical protein
MLLSYDSDMINIFKIILNPISNMNYTRRVEKTSMLLKNLIRQSCYLN